ncbi:MAG TPA: SRPBCC family protein [Solirubrobacteraceae bacterium]|nr:SRPBCC family protein [Solirubrobacteraceae bacterium]
MKLTNEFTVPAPADEAFAVLLDVERVAPCLPGAALSGGDGETFDGTMTIKLGPVTSRFEGTVRIVETDRAARRAVLRAQARDARGAGTAAATITTSLQPAQGGTRVQVETDLQVSGPVAQFGRGVMQDVSGKLMRQFAGCLAEEMGAAAAPGPASDDVQSNGTVRHPVVAEAGALQYERTAVGRLPKGPAADAAVAAAAAGRPAAAPRERRTADVLDLGAASRGAVLKRAVPVAVAAAAALGAVIAWRRRAV